MVFLKAGGEVPPDLWGKEDKNKDGVIEFHEFARGMDNDEL